MVKNGKKKVKNEMKKKLGKIRLKMTEVKNGMEKNDPPSQQQQQLNDPLVILVLNDHRRRKSKIKFQKLKSQNQKIFKVKKCSKIF